MIKYFIIMLALVVNVSAAPFISDLSMHQPMMDHQIHPMDQPVMNQMMMNQMMEQQMLEQMMQQNQYNALQQQLMAMQQLQTQQMNNINLPMMLNLPPQSIIMFLPNAMTKTSNRLHNLNERDQPNLKLTNDNSDSVIIDADNDLNVPTMEAIPRQAVLVLPNGQRFFIGSVISAIPFLPFEVNVPDTIAWMYNGIAGIIGGIGQRLPFRPNPTTTESPNATATPSPIQTQESVTPMEESRLKWLLKLVTRKQSVGMPILMLPGAQPVPIQLPIQV